MLFNQALENLIRRQDLTPTQMQHLMRTLMRGEATSAQIAAFLVALRMKGESVSEITAAAQVMRELVTPVEIADKQHLVDIVGTGGDGANLFNVSTASSFVVAAAGGRVAKHGNRSASSSSGSADLIEAAGIRLDLNPEQVKACIEQIGVGFMFAPQHHTAMKHVIGPRKEMGVRTLFNVLGPLTNPAQAPHMLLGVYSQSLVSPLAQVLHGLGAKHVLVVCSDEGLDELSIAGSTRVAELKHGHIEEYSITPEALGLSRHPLDSLKVANAQQSLQKVVAALQGTETAASEMLALNAGAALYAADIADTLAAGVHMAQDAIASGMAYQKMQELASFTEACQA
ncbi:anthranilate phosphoribosyltransferase [Allopseudospirillum japonicum]|uniref:Anthranilate phosphoribosyltransferase n=1 Tax=Allopseudospirillum japonicum TaxID=64971 RepID=A0A1H6RF57_9GAMM|nr:anthranilate phosphoribosyltransferase [Allopseudospirillum japonicum]SEI54393.1 anthranilate phosphoribosyltransferase [Allopseudospirillum japonicum]